QQVEDSLSSLRILAEQKKTQESSLAHARLTEQLMMHHYMAGLKPYSDVLMAQTARLNSEQAMLAVRQSRLDASVALIQALGG
ncbi:TolC family protein, partial [Escherichia coli]|uniref:TolC family protein n=1 Tax=Escherichia coli TaxID=562 RepID=UPI0039DF71C0